ncbi:solute carrier family 22 member 23 [Homo sapiens]|uniref:Solute carrier family 22 member 23 n=2 Tax=Homo sapiens TaxID=9606 RepID=C9J4Z0_HUMAN|nr:solute carrier family 22 member 23 isoform X9 [Homo sapiens]KAI2540710.1 solute carrier family 22 member 23 [Homo sapiens]KAI4016679.1 solute carrier family 22 member 23 [Homo sapiens]
MAIDRRREAAGGGPGRQPAPAEENGSLPPGDAAASAPLGGRAGPGGGAEIQPLPPLHPGGGPHPSCCSAAAAPSLLLLDYDGSVLPFLGGLGGGYQKTLVLLTWIPALFIGFSQFSDSFLLDQPNFWCRGAGKGTELAGVTTTGRGGDMGNWTSLPTTPFATAPWEAAGNRSNSSGADGGDTPPLPSPPDKGDNASNCDCRAWDYGIRAGLVQNVVSKWDLVCDNAWKVHIAKFSLLVGLIFGYLITGCIADWVGRRPVLLFSIIFILIFGLTVALSVNVTMFSTLRFFEGFCLAGIILTLYALRIELCPPGKRFMITMVASFVAMAGQFLMPGLAALCRDWQVLQALIICPFLLMLLYWSIFPESLRWLMATQQFESAKRLILHFTQKNRMNPEGDIKGVIPELEKELSRRPKKVCIVKVVGTRNLWKNIVVLCVNSLTGYGIHHCFARSMMGHEVKVPLLENFYADYYTTASIALVSCLAMCVVVRFLGRRGGLLLFMILTALASLLQLGLLNLIGKYSQHPDSELQLKLAVGMSDSVKDKFSIAFSIVGMFASHAVGSLSVFFCAEITPTVIRCGGLGLVLASAGFGMLTAPIIELHNQKGYFLHHIIFACCTLICIICILLLPESRDQNLPENISNGEHYTRQPLLPHKKGEQPLLLTNAELKDYSGLHDAAAAGDTLPEGATANGMKAM